MARTKSTSRMACFKRQIPPEQTNSTVDSKKVVAVWEFFDKIWIAYDEKTNQIIETAFQKDKNSFISFTALNGEQYLITFGDMMQENLRTNYRRKVRRSEKPVVVEDEMKDIIEVNVDHSGPMVDGIMRFFGKKEYSDFVFYVGEREIFVHKWILCTRR
jgi:hypothetical protein